MFTSNPERFFFSCLKDVTSLVRQLHSRDSRRQFCAEGHWLSRKIHIDPTQVNPIINFTPLKVTRIPQSGKFVLLKYRILGIGIRNSALGIQNPANDWSPEFVQDAISLFFFFSRALTSAQEKRARHPRFLFIYLFSTISEGKIEGL